jgi:hypothetical protein
VRPLVRAAAIASLVLLAAACNKGPAEDAIEDARQALEAARPELARYAPGELASIERALADARSSLDEGHYTESLKTAQGLPARIDAAAASAAAKKEVLTKAWSAAVASLGPRLAALGARLADLESTREPSRRLDPAWLASARADLVSLQSAWGQAGAAFEAGEVAGALRAAQDVEARAAALSRVLGLPAVPAAAPAAPTPAPRPAPPAAE